MFRETKPYSSGNIQSRQQSQFHARSHNANMHHMIMEDEHDQEENFEYDGYDTQHKHKEIKRIWRAKKKQRPGKPRF
jgi:hypothetical protein